ncbi:MAG: hypothetical protein AAGE52_36605, partial [Myxococcota bacterium]
MTIWRLGVGALFLLAACGDDACVDNADCLEGERCVDALCIPDDRPDPPRCGDGVREDDEDCDDANFVSGDGCEDDCRYTCSMDSECDDGNPCNGLESCDGNRCELLSGPMDGLACSRGGDDGVCRSGICVAEGCGNGIVDDGEDCDDENAVAGDGCEADCTFSCVADVDCGDGDECTVGESCDTEAHRCVPGAPLACDDDDPCTEDLCEALSGCIHPLIDDDGDGHAPSTLGECGTDCDDDNASVFAGAEELCDDIDN